MARPLHKFSAKAVEAIDAPGRHGDGGGLYLHVRHDGRRQWSFLYRWGGRQKEMGLGSFLPVEPEKGVRYEHTSLAEARRKATDARAALAKGIDPMVARNAAAEVPTFGAFADELIDDLAPGFRNEKHVAQWRMTLGDAYCRALRKRPLNEIGTDDVLKVLRPIWTKRPETASRVRGRIERALDAAKAKALREGENPARWRGHLDALLPAPQKLKRGHHAAMPYGDVPAFVRRLRCAEAMAARALEFAILTAARSGEVLGGEWSEFDLDAAIWTVPAGRMKAGREHRVPLCDRAVAIVKALGKARVGPYVFAGAKPKMPLSNMSLAMQMRRMKVGHFTVHGFRSAFRDWAAEETSHPREIAEAALAHVVGDATERAYRRGDALEKRRALMKDWGNFCA
ncbi:site-specific integrase [Hyphomicrobium sp. CS1BSMeth3]|uniref:tyrosine-type recombinase/integrase n=1 Tax=Hyphomicrobium sp. CS1BSMeth3 TaxID=1892844 RepID=UPI0009314814|nr:site-specific integrase [Hyphomicrobium sp. CS1BSMeth3]